jgi:hypothetical protein
MRSRWKIAVLLLIVVLAAGPAAAQQVGTATAVNPLSESTPPGANTIALTVGARVVHKERIHTTPSGSVQLLFLDKSTLSIAPNTNLLIDEYVYDPHSNSGHMLISLTEGALRFVGGELSHQGDATVVTPAAAIGIRGATGTIQHGKQGTLMLDHFGTFTIHNGAGDVIIKRPGFYVTVADWRTPPSEILMIPEALNAHFIKIMTSKPGQNGGVPGLKTIVIDDCIAGAGQSGGAGSQNSNCPQTPWTNTAGGESDAFQLIIQATQQATGTQSVTGTGSHRRRGN